MVSYIIIFYIDIILLRKAYGKNCLYNCTFMSKSENAKGHFKKSKQLILH